MYEYCVRIRRSNEEREWLCIRFDRRTIAVLLATRHTLHMPTLAYDSMSGVGSVVD